MLKRLALATFSPSTPSQYVSSKNLSIWATVESDLSYEPGFHHFALSISILITPSSSHKNCLNITHVRSGLRSGSRSGFVS